MSQKQRNLVERVATLKPRLPQLGLGSRLPELSTYLNSALEYLSSDPQSSLTKMRIVLEKMLLAHYRSKMEKEPPRPMIGDMLSEKIFIASIPRRVFYRMQSIKDMSNLGPHGEEVECADAIRVMRDLLDVLEWYVDAYPATIETVIKNQIEMMKGFPLVYFEGMDYDEIERMLAEDMGISLSSVNDLEVAFRSSFPQFLSWLQAQTKENQKPKE